MSISQAHTIQFGDTVLFSARDRQTFIRTLQADQHLQTHFGVIQYNDLVGLPYGTQVQTHLGKGMFVLQPSLDDIILSLHRETQILYPKDMGYLLMKMNLLPGMQVIEAGTGSGALTLLLGLLVGEEGRVYSYERKASNQRLAARHARRFGVAQRIEFIERDIAEGFDQQEAHALFLDVPDPAAYLPQARQALRGGGFLGALVPTVNKMTLLLEQLYHGMWYYLQAEEVLLRGWKTTPSRVRPDDQMVGHTGFLVFARAVQRDVPEEEPPLSLEDTQPAIFIDLDQAADEDADEADVR